MPPPKKIVTIPPAYPNDASARPQVLKKGRPANNPQATRFSTNADAVVGTVLGGMQGHRTAAQEAKQAALRKKDAGAAFNEDVKAAVKTTTDFYKMRSPAPQLGAKGRAAVAKKKR